MDVSSCEVSSLSVDWSILIGLESLFSEDGLDGVELLVLVVLVFVFVLVRENEDDEALLDDDVDCSRELTRLAWLLLSLLIISTSWSSLICSVSSSFLLLELSSCFMLKPNSMSNLFTFGLVLLSIVELGLLDEFSRLLLDSAEFELHVN